jgi:ribosomal protein S18 acetylase RimI-like enzyme
MSLTFKHATENEAALISSLAHKIWHEHYPDIITVEQIDYMLTNRYSAGVIAQQMKAGEKYFLAYSDNEPVAYASFELKGDHYYLHKFYVDVSKHRGGIGHEFFTYLLQQMDSSKPIRLQVNRQNYKAVNFYFKEGFIIETVGDFHIGGNYYMNDFVMKRLPI